MEAAAPLNVMVPDCKLERTNSVPPSPAPLRSFAELREPVPEGSPKSPRRKIFTPQACDLDSRFTQFDLITPDGKIQEIKRISQTEARLVIRIENIAPFFVGYQISERQLQFNSRATIAQLGVNIVGDDIILEPGNATVRARAIALNPLGVRLLDQLQPGAIVGKLFAADDRRRVRHSVYLTRMANRTDRYGRPLLKFGSDATGMKDVRFEEINGRLIAHVQLVPGRVDFEEDVEGLLPTVVKAFTAGRTIRDTLALHQRIVEGPRRPQQEAPFDQREGLVIVKTRRIYLRTVFARVAADMLPEGYACTSANVMEPDMNDVSALYELVAKPGGAPGEISSVPLEFFTLEAYREHVHFGDRDQLQVLLERPEVLFDAMRTAPAPRDSCAAVYIVKGHQLLDLTPDDWVTRNPTRRDFPGLASPQQQAEAIDEYIRAQAEYPFLKQIDQHYITSQGVLISRYFPSPCLKGMLLNDNVRWCLKGVYFETPSRGNGEFFSQEDRALMIDLAKFGVPVYRLDTTTNTILQFVHKAGKDSGMFVPSHRVDHFMRATLFGVYGSNLVEGDFEGELRRLLLGVLDLKGRTAHPLLNPDTPLALLTGGGPGAMAVGNRVAKSVGILSCANICDFSPKTPGVVVNEQKINPDIEAKMSFRLEKLVERQAEFNLDFPIFLVGGVGTDFEYALEEVRRKVGTTPAHPVLLFGPVEFWRDKLRGKFQANLASGTIKGSEWLSNCFFQITTAEEGLKVFERFFSGELAIGKGGPVYDDGFCIVSQCL
eukprot:tig00020710_g13307.t1